MHKIKTLFDTSAITESQRATIKIGKTPIEIALKVDKQGRTTARKLYTFLEMNQSNYSKWCKRNITENDFAEENVDYVYSSLSTSKRSRGNFAQDYILTATFAKKLAMASNSAKGEQAREYFIKVEEQLKKIIVSAGVSNLEHGASIAQPEDRITLDEIVLLSKMQAVTRYNLGTASIRKIADDCHAVIRIGRRVLYHRQILDDYFKDIAE